MSKATNILKQYWGYEQFRPLQEDIVEAVLAGQDTLALLPTGGGKSICFQVPAMAMEGICIVVSPLIALMQDQVEQLTKRGIKAAAIYNGMHARQIDYLLDNCIYGDIKFLYVSPERLKTDLFIARAKQMKIAIIAIDEAHCISQWGYDFRPPYLEIVQFKELFPDTPCIALTASANEEVKKDIIEKLALKKPKIFQKSFSRANLSYSILWEENKEERVLKMLEKIQGTAIVYVRNRKKTQEIAQFLSKNGVSADFYHAGLLPKQRIDKQQAWINNQCRVIVATNAFGMGIDKPDVRLVVHLDLPDSLEAYYQEAGRAGRDEKKAFACILVEEKDIIDLKTQFEKQFPEPETLKRTYQAISNFLQLAEGAGELAVFDFDWPEMCKRFNLSKTETYYAIKCLENEGLFVLNESTNIPSNLKINLSSTEMYDFQLRNPKFELLLKALLRLHGGVIYNEYVKIDELQIAQLLKSPLPEIERNLALLEKFEVLDYDKKSGHPKLTFLTPRAFANNLPIRWNEYYDRKKRYFTKIEAIEHYVRQDIRCRTQQIVAYFGETLHKKCGLCDICINEKRANTGKAFPEGNPEAKELMLKYLQNGPVPLQTLVDCLRPLSPKEAIRTIQYYLDLGEIQMEGEEIAIFNT
jgi:ATP-dependent DNA helicase RecQ